MSRSEASTDDSDPEVPMPQDAEPSPGPASTSTKNWQISSEGAKKREVLMSEGLFSCSRALELEAGRNLRPMHYDERSMGL